MVSVVPAFQDNYIWIISRNDLSAAVVVDPGEASGVIQWLDGHHCALAGILVTHHHADHTGGIADLMTHAMEHHPQRPLPIIGPARARIPEITTEVRDGDRVRIDALGITWSVLDVPGHTRDHIAFYSEDDLNGTGQPSVFCGDTLFAAGCGRLFEGTAEQMWASLQKLTALPNGTQVYCAHEYTLSNLVFAHHALPDHSAIADRLEHVRRLRAEGHMTVPTTMDEERRTNPFLLCRDVHAFAAMRERKDQFRG